jgi:Flp pilus assembly protein TadG
MLRKLVTDRRGVTALEFALVAPLAIPLMLAVVEGGRYYFTAQSLSTAVGEEARAAVIRANRWAICYAEEVEEIPQEIDTCETPRQATACAAMSSDAAISAAKTNVTQTYPFLRPANLSDPTISCPDGYSVQVTLAYQFDAIFWLPSTLITDSTLLHFNAPPGGGSEPGGGGTGGGGTGGGTGGNGNGNGNGNGSR